ncbi:MAG: dimethylarginine dimethylaminohydrolase family protein [Alphaproteobacteria bacterium]
MTTIDRTADAGARPPIRVVSEWGALRECVYGGSGQFVLPRFLHDSKARAYGAFEAFWIANQGRPAAEADPVWFAAWQAQIDGAVALLRRLGVVVHQPAPISAANLRFPRGENHGCMTGWLRDPFAVIGDNVIELAPRSLFHRRQRFAIRAILAATMDRGARYFAQPDCGADDSVDGPGWGYLEGGDIFVLGRKVLVGHSGHCSNPEGARWLQHALGPGYEVEVVPIDPLFPHLDCVLMTPREGVAVICRDAFPAGLPPHLRDWDHIEVGVEEAKRHLACNNLVLDDRTVVVPSEPPLDRVATALTARRFEVIRIPYEAVYRVGGSFRCAHQPLVRV